MRGCFDIVEVIGSSPTNPITEKASLVDAFSVMK